MLTECLIEGLDPSIDVTARFVQLAQRRVLDRDGNPVQDLVIAGERYASREEVVEHEIRIDALPNRAATISPAGSERAELTEGGGAPAGALEWRWEPLHATIEAWIEEIAPGLRQVHINVANRLEWDGDSEQAALRAFYLTAVILHSPDGAFASLAEPPPHLREQSAACNNEGLWPVPVGEVGDRRTILASPMPLEDYPPPRRRAPATSL